MQKLKHRFLEWYVIFSGNRIFYKILRRINMLTLHSLGIFNSISPRASGEQFFLKTFINHIPEGIVFDIGANQGFYSIMMRKMSERLQIYAFEPHPKTYQLLEKGAELHRFRSFNIGFGDEKTEAVLYDYDSRDGSTHASLYRGVIENIHGGSATGHPIDIDTVDHFTRENHIGQIDLLKIDTEGNELNVLKGATRMLQEGRIHCIQFEFNELNVVSRVFLGDFLKLLPDFSFFRLLGKGWVLLNNYPPIYQEIFGYQNIIALHRQSPLFPVFKSMAIE
jgi:FkbM family methyltransferase